MSANKKKIDFSGTFLNPPALYILKLIIKLNKFKQMKNFWKIEISPSEGIFNVGGFWWTAAVVDTALTIGLILWILN